MKAAPDRLRSMLLLGVAGMILPVMPVAALPSDLSIAEGAASSSANGSSLNIIQNTPYLLADWQSFDIASGEMVQFVQPDSAAIAVNRIWSATPTQIDGALQANGQIFLLNPYGLIFGKNASVDAAAFGAIAMRMSDQPCAQSLCLEENGTGASVVQQGQIKSAKGGTVILAAPHVENSGVIAAENGSAILMAAGQISLMVGADGQMVARAEKGVAGGQITHSGLMSVGGGRALLSAQSDAFSDALSRAVINQSGVIEADNLVARGGQVVLEADAITMADSARISAQGAGGGGAVQIGGAGSQMADAKVAQEIFMASGAVIDASGMATGDGGVILLGGTADQGGHLAAHGQLRALGGASGGNGGFIETSGAFVDIAGLRANASAANGTSGTWLIDPYDYYIDATAAAAIAGDAQGGLNSGTNVVISTMDGTGPGAVGAGFGDIVVASSILKSSGGDATLTLKAERHINVQSGVEIGSSSNKLGIILNSDSDATSGGAIQINNAILRSNGGDIILSGGLDPLTGYATGTTGLLTGIDIRRNAQILSNGGNIILRGQGAATTPASSSDYMAGIGFMTASGEAITVDAGAGRISLSGYGGGATGSTQGWRQAIIINQHNSGAAHGTVTITSTNSAVDAIFLDSIATSGTGTNRSSIDMRHGTTINGNMQVLCDNCLFNGATSEGNVIFNAPSFSVAPKNTSFSVAPIINGSYSGNHWIGAASSYFAGVQFTNFKLMNGFTLGNSSSNTSITLNSAITMAGNFSLLGLTLNINAPITLTGAGSALLLKAKDNIITPNGTSAAPFVIQTNNGNIIFHADSNAYNGGNIQIGDYNVINSANGSTSQQSGGGMIAFGGGSDNGRNGINSYDRNIGDGIPDYFAQGYYTANSFVTAAGVYVGQMANIYSGGGNIFMAGRTPTSTVGNVQAVGIYIASGVIDAGAGKIQLWGKSNVTNNTANPYSHAIWLNGNTLNQTTSLISANSASDALILNGDAASSTTVGSSGIFTYNGANGDWGTRIVATNGGGISITGKSSTGANATGTGEYGDGIDLNFTQILNKNGAITLSGTGGAYGISLGGRAASGNMVQLGRMAGVSVNGVSMASNSGAISLNANNFILNRGASSGFAANIATSGAVSFAPISSSFSSFSLSGWSLPSDMSALNIGKSGNSAAFSIDQALSINGALNIWAGAVNVNANVATTASGNITIHAGNAFTIASGKSLATSNGNIILNVARFVNQSNASALQAGGSGKYWQVWSSNAAPFTGATPDVRGGLVYTFKQYNALYGSTTAAQNSNGFLYSLAPSISASLSGSAQKTYDGNISAPLGNLILTSASGVDGDSLSLSAPGYAYFANAQAGQNKIVYAGGYSLTSAVDGTTGVPVYGYSLPEISANIGNIAQRLLSITGLYSADKIYDGSKSASLLGTAVLGNVVGAMMCSWAAI